MKFLLTGRHWQIFLLLIIVFTLAETKIEDHPTLTTVFNIIGTSIYFLWPVLVGHQLQNYLPKKIELNYTFFMVNGFLIILIIIGGTIITGGGEWHFEGLAALPVFYLLFALFYVFSFPERTMRSIEYNREASLSESVGDFFLTFFLPIGIWFLQPRINKIVETLDNLDETEQQLNRQLLLAVLSPTIVYKFKNNLHRRKINKRCSGYSLFLIGCERYHPA